MIVKISYGKKAITPLVLQTIPHCTNFQISYFEPTNNFQHVLLKSLY